MDLGTVPGKVLSLLKWSLFLLALPLLGAVAGYRGALYVYKHAQSENQMRPIRAIEGGYVDGDLIEVLFNETFPSGGVDKHDAIGALYRRLASQPISPGKAREMLGLKMLDNPDLAYHHLVGVACLDVDIPGFGKRGDIIWIIWGTRPSFEHGNFSGNRLHFRRYRIVNAYWVNARTGAVQSIFPPELVRKQLQGPLPWRKTRRLTLRPERRRDTNGRFNAP